MRTQQHALTSTCRASVQNKPTLQTPPLSAVSITLTHTHTPLTRLHSPSLFSLLLLTHFFLFNCRFPPLVYPMFFSINVCGKRHSPTLISAVSPQLHPIHTFFIQSFLEFIRTLALGPTSYMLAAILSRTFHLLGVV